ncbi:MAG: hypothetical protein CMK92_05265 [Pseudomonas sp.]|nr:hypothetical protein [Pseudomonas sp.]
MKLLDFISDIFNPLERLVDNVHTSDEELGQLKNEFTRLQNAVTTQLIRLESQRLEAQQAVVTSEAKSESWLARNWRPITMLTFLLLILLDSFGLLAVPLAPQMWDLLEIGLGGYVVGRSVEKTAKTVVPVFTDFLKARR